LNNFKYIYNLLFVVIGLLLFSCEESKHQENNSLAKIKTDSLTYLNHSDSAKYVGINTCRLCHQDIYNTFIETGMGKSFDIASKSKSSGNYHSSVIYDKIGDYHYKAYWEKDSLKILEYRLQGKDTVHKRIETVNYIVGSGQHTNSHIQSVNGYLNQMPMTFYTQKKQWDLPPGFEDGHNSRFMRKIGLECMSCHNSYPDFVLGSENKYKAVEKGIGCERCHGPGSIHVAERSKGTKIDTSKYIDYSIVNPAKLTIDRQFDICQRCHLQGNTILKEGKSFYDFKPGMVLSDYMTVFLPKYKHADDEFIMASHADRLKQSACFIASTTSTGSVAKANKLKPYKDAMTCVTCHNPHISVRNTNSNVFNEACNTCHDTNGKSQLICSKKGIIKTSDCVSCHMPKSGSIDIPHVTVHDHYIRKPLRKKDKEGIKEFIGLYAINEKNPSKITKAKAYLNQYEKFELKPEYLDSAKSLLSDKNNNDITNNLELLIQWCFLKNNFNQIINYVTTLKDDVVLGKLNKTTYSNENAWTSYRIGEAFYNIGKLQKAILYYQNAVKLAPYVLDFRNKFASALASNNQLAEAEKEFTEIIKENPKHVSALTNLGYLKLNKGDVIACDALYKKALSFDPDYEPLLLNMAGFCAYKKDFIQSKQYIERILKRNPNNKQAQQALAQLKRYIK
jgi:tetratricopeptide (TPR) repeat protein